jgi:type I restriction enzyme M protein
MQIKDRVEIETEIWKKAEELSGSEGWDFKQYVLGILFYRFISENLAYYINANQQRAGQKDFDYTKFDDEKANLARTETIAEKGFFILPSELFSNIAFNAKNNSSLNETLSNVFRNIDASALGASSESAFKGLFDEIDLNSSKLGETVAEKNARLASLVKSINEWDLGNFLDGTIYLYGDTYEHLINMFASTAGKKGGDFFTPSAVSDLLARITLIGKNEISKVYDPACGSGSLLLKFASVLGADKVTNGFFGQDENQTFYNLCRINMVLHNINYEKFSIAQGDTLITPRHWDDQPFDAIVSNPRFSKEWKGSDDPLLINDPRFSPAGVLAPKSKHDMAFIMHTVNWLSTNGVAALAQHPGVMYRGGTELSIRRYLIENNYVDAVIQLPPNLFFGVTLAPYILVLKKSRTVTDVIFVNAEKEFVRSGNKNKLSPENISKILNWLSNRKDIDYCAKVVNSEEIKLNKFNLSVSTYIQAEDTREAVNIDLLNQAISKIVSDQNVLRSSIDVFIDEFEGDFK